MGIEEPGSCSPVGHFLGRGESPFVIIAGGAGESGDLEVQDRQTDIRWIGDVNVAVKSWRSSNLVDEIQSADPPTFNPAEVHVSPMVFAITPRIIPNSPYDWKGMRDLQLSISSQKWRSIWTYNCPRPSFSSLTSWSIAKRWTSSGWMGVAKLDVQSLGKGILCTDPRACSISVIKFPGSFGWDGDEVV